MKQGRLTKPIRLKLSGKFYCWCCQCKQSTSSTVSNGWEFIYCDECGTCIKTVRTG